MSQSALSTTSFYAAVPRHAADSDGPGDLSLVSDLGVVLALSGLFFVLLKRLWRREGAPSRPPARKRVEPIKPKFRTASGSSNAKRARPLPVRRRVIRLHEVTPGQAPYEYNVGDGTTGFCLLRAA